MLKQTEFSFDCSLFEGRQRFFITGTDTDCGKTYVTRLLIKHFQQQGKSITALKPIASGINEQGFNQDAFLLAQDTGVKVEQVNPICFQQPIAPSIAAEIESRPITVQAIWEASQPILQSTSDIKLIEGVGGLMVPLNAQETVVDLIQQFNFPIILVVGLRLGCLNHAILAYQALLQANIEIAGWIANQVDPNMLSVAENIETLKIFLKAPYWGFVAYSA